MHGSAPPPPTHPGPYQLMPVAGPNGGPPHPHPHHPHQHQHQHQMMPPGSAPHSAQGAPVPPPPWMAGPGSGSGAGERGPYSAEPQSYVRGHPSSHARAASPQ